MLLTARPMQRVNVKQAIANWTPKTPIQEFPNFSVNPEHSNSKISFNFFMNELDSGMRVIRGMMKQKRVYANRQIPICKGCLI